MVNAIRSTAFVAAVSLCAGAFAEAPKMEAVFTLPGGRTQTRHDEVAPNVFRTSNANGESTLVNYNETAVTVDGTVAKRELQWGSLFAAGWRRALPLAGQIGTTRRYEIGKVTVE